MAPPAPLLDRSQGGPVVHIKAGKVFVDWLTHARLDEEVLALAEADHVDHEVVTHYETVREAMNTALGAILHGLGYRTRSPCARFGYTVLSSR